MNKIDLIIDALECAKQQTIKGVMYPAGYHMVLAQALAAARELKATYPQGAKVRPAEFIAAASVGVGADFIGTPMMWAEWPTRPERVFVVHDVGCAVNGYGECDCFGGVKA